MNSDSRNVTIENCMLQTEHTPEMVRKANCICYGHWPKLQVWPEPKYLGFVCAETKALQMKYDCGGFKRDRQMLWYFCHQDYSGLPLAWTINQAPYLQTSKIELKWHSVQVLWKDMTSNWPFLEEHVSRTFGPDFWCPATLKPKRTHRVHKVQRQSLEQVLRWWPPDPQWMWV